MLQPSLWRYEPFAAMVFLTAPCGGERLRFQRLTCTIFSLFLARIRRACSEPRSPFYGIFLDYFCSGLAARIVFRNIFDPPYLVRIFVHIERKEVPLLGYRQIRFLRGSRGAFSRCIFRDYLQSKRSIGSVSSKECSLYGKVEKNVRIGRNALAQEAGVFWTFSRFSSSTRRITSATDMPRRFASDLSHTICGLVKTIERWMIAMRTSYTLVQVGVN